MAALIPLLSNNLPVQNFVFKLTGWFSGTFSQAGGNAWPPLKLSSGSEAWSQTSTISMFRQLVRFANSWATPQASQNGSSVVYQSVSLSPPEDARWSLRITTLGNRRAAQSWARGSPRLLGQQASCKTSEAGWGKWKG